MRWWTPITKCWKLSAPTAVRVGRWGYSVLCSSSSILLLLETHTVFWRSQLRTVVTKQTTAAQLESRLQSGWQLQFPGLDSKKSIPDSGEETRHLICSSRKTIPSPVLSCISCFFELHLLPPLWKESQFWWCQQDSSKRVTCHQRAASQRKPGAAPRESAGCQPQRHVYVIEQGQGAEAACPSFHQISQATRSSSSKTVQTKHYDFEKDKWHKKSKESLKLWCINISLDHLLPQLNSSIMYKRKVMRSWKVGEPCRKDETYSHLKSRLKKSFRNPGPKA